MDINCPRFTKALLLEERFMSHTITPRMNYYAAAPELFGQLMGLTQAAHGAGVGKGS